MSSGPKSLFRDGCEIFPALSMMMKRILPVFVVVGLVTGCASTGVLWEGLARREKPEGRSFYLGDLSRLSFVSTYQESKTARGPQQRTGTEGLDPIIPVLDSRQPVVQEMKEIKEIAGKTRIDLTLEDAVVRALANSPEITVVSFDPSIAKENITIAESEFDVTAFGELGYEKDDSLSNDIFDTGQFQSRLYEGGVKQKSFTGAEWRLAYALTRSSDESVNRRFSTGYEPAVVFELKQPLLRDAWSDVNLADVDIARLNYRMALAAFRQKAEDVAAQVISLYWALFQARRDLEIQQSLLNKTIETFKKVKDRKNIDATVGDIKQTESSVKSRQATLFDAERRVFDVQDRLVRLLADYQMRLTDDLEIIPVTAPEQGGVQLNQREHLQVALKNNPGVIRTRLEVEVAEINVSVAKRQKMPRLDLVANAQVQGLSDLSGEAHQIMYDRDHTSYTVGVAVEYPLGNREKRAEFRLRQLERAKALSKLNNVSDQVAALVKEQIRFAETAHREIQVQQEAVAAAKIHLQALEDIETIRKNLTPEFLLAKIQAQESLAISQRAEVKAVVDFNIAMTRLAQATGTVLDMRYIRENAQSFTTIN